MKVQTPEEFVLDHQHDNVDKVIQALEKRDVALRRDERGRLWDLLEKASRERNSTLSTWLSNNRAAVLK